MKEESQKLDLANMPATRYDVVLVLKNLEAVVRDVEAVHLVLEKINACMQVLAKFENLIETWQTERKKELELAEKRKEKEEEKLRERNQELRTEEIIFRNRVGMGLQDLTVGQEALRETLNNMYKGGIRHHHHAGWALPAAVVLVLILIVQSIVLSKTVDFNRDRAVNDLKYRALQFTTERTPDRAVDWADSLCRTDPERFRKFVEMNEELRRKWVDAQRRKAESEEELRKLEKGSQ